MWYINNNNNYNTNAFSNNICLITELYYVLYTLNEIENNSN